MFIKNKYTKCYFSIVNRAKSRILSKSEYSERHHIIPKSLGGSNTIENLVELTAKEHFVCHHLLTKMTEGDSRTKMVFAAWRMAVQGKPSQKRYTVTARTYLVIKKQRSDYLKTLVGPLSPLYGTKTGRTSADFTSEWRSNIGESRKGQSSWNKGIPRTADEKAKIAATRKQRAKNSNWNLRPACSLEKAQKIKEANLGKRWAHHIETKERKYVSPNEFIQLIQSGWTPGLGPR